MGNFGQFLKITSDWKEFFYKFYELDIYPGALFIYVRFDHTLSPSYVRFFSFSSLFEYYKLLVQIPML